MNNHTRWIHGDYVNVDEVRISCVFIACVICVFGGFISALSVAVYCKIPLKNASSVLLSAMCLGDTIKLILAMFYVTSYVLHRWNCFGSSQVALSLTHGNLFLLAASRRLCVLLHCAICTERFVVVCLPFNVKQADFLQRPKLLISILSITSVLSVLPILFKARLIQIDIYNGTYKVLTWNMTQSYHNHRFSYNVVGQVSKISFYYIPFCLILAFAILVKQKLNKSIAFAGSRRHMSGSNNKKMQQLTKIILASSVSFCIFNLPLTVTRITQNILPRRFGPGTSREQLFLALADVCLLLDLVGSSIGFVFYYKLSRSFRCTLKVICRPIRRLTNQLRLKRLTNETI